MLFSVVLTSWCTGCLAADDIRPVKLDVPLLGALHVPAVGMLFVYAFWYEFSKAARDLLVARVWIIF
jgi:hypothetical protein